LRCVSLPHARRTVGSFPTVLQPVQQIDIRLEVRNIVAEILRLAVRVLDFLALLEIFRIKILDALNRSRP